MINVTEINKSFGDSHILKNVSANFEAGIANLIIGQSGSGKTVFIKSLVGLHDIDSGEIDYDGRSVTKLNNKQRQILRQEMGMVFQGSALFDSYSVKDNVMFPLNMFTNDTYATKLKQVEFCLDRVNLPGVLELMPSELSGGMQKRVAIARAIALNPKYLFCDEPNSGLDPKTAIIIDKLIKEITEEFKITTIINTHDMNSVLEIGDKVNFIYKGEKWWEGNKDSILESSNEELNDFIYSSEILKKLDPRNKSTEHK